MHIRPKFDRIFKNTQKRLKDQKQFCGQAILLKTAKFLQFSHKKPRSQPWLKVCGCVMGAR